MEGNYAIISSGKGMEDIIMARAAAISFKEFRVRYHTEAACREELFRQRFPEGFVCPKCGCEEFYAIRSRNICQCRSCRRQTSVTAGTVMHRSGPTILRERMIPIASSAGKMLPFCTNKRPTGRTSRSVVGIIAIIKFMVFHVLLNHVSVKSLKDWTAPTKGAFIRRFAIFSRIPSKIV